MYKIFSFEAQFSRKPCLKIHEIRHSVVKNGIIKIMHSRFLQNVSSLYCKHRWKLILNALSRLNLSNCRTISISLQSRNILHTWLETCSHKCLVNFQTWSFSKIEASDKFYFKLLFLHIGTMYHQIVVYESPGVR